MAGDTIVQFSNRTENSYSNSINVLYAILNLPCHFGPGSLVSNGRGIDKRIHQYECSTKVTPQRTDHLEILGRSFNMGLKLLQCGEDIG